MSSEQNKDLVAKKMHVVLLDLITHIINIYIYIYVYVCVFCHMSVLETCYNVLGKV